MRNAPNNRVLGYKMPDPNTGIVYQNDNEGWYIIPYNGLKFTVISSAEGGWDHVSVSLKHRTPTWQEMEHVRKLFFKDDEVCIQYHVPEKDHINMHNFCLHIWRPHGIELPMPPKIMI